MRILIDPGRMRPCQRPHAVFLEAAEARPALLAVSQGHQPTLYGAFPSFDVHGISLNQLH